MGRLRPPELPDSKSTSAFVMGLDGVKSSSNGVTTSFEVAFSFALEVGGVTSRLKGIVSPLDKILD